VTEPKRASGDAPSGAEAEPAPKRPSDPQLADWFDDLDSLLREVSDLLRPLSDAQLNWRPGPGKWSIGECIEHLTITGDAIAAQVDRALEAARARGISGRGPFDLGWLGRWWVGAVGPNGKRAVRAPAIFTPGSSLKQGEMLARFQRMRAGVLRVLDRAQGLDLRRVKARSAVIPLFRLNAASWLACLPAHEHRHLNQARRVLADPAFPR
jgi:hypothetical protein